MNLKDESAHSPVVLELWFLSRLRIHVLIFIPVSALAGIVFVACIHIFKWYAIDMIICAFAPAKLRLMLRLPSRKVNRADVIIIVPAIVLFTIITISFKALLLESISPLSFIIQVKTTGRTWAYFWTAINKLIQVKRTVDESGKACHLKAPFI